MKARYVPLMATIFVFGLIYAYAYDRFESFGTPAMVANLLRSNAYLGITAIGMTFVIIAGGIDLSVGSVIAFTGVFCALMIEREGMHPYEVFAIVLAMGTAFGAIMGSIIHFFKIPPFIVTLSGMFLARGMAFVLTTDSITIRHPVYRETFKDLVYILPDKGRITFATGAFVAVLVLGILLAHFTRFGRNIYAIGGNKSAAMSMGVPVARTVISVYALSSLLATLSGIVLSLSKYSGDASIAVGVELDVIAAVVIGGTLLTGGSGYVIGTFFGVLLPQVIRTYLILDGKLNSWWTQIVVGGLLFGFLVLQKLLSSRQGILRLQPRNDPEPKLNSTVVDT